MDALHFDALTRRLTLGLNRRRGLGLVACLGLSGLLAPDLTAAKKRKRKKKKPCPPCKKRKKGKCKGTLPDGMSCGECKQCQRGACVAKADGTACPGGTCQGGTCQTDPCPGEKLCKGECIPTEQCCTKEDCLPVASYRCCNGLCTDELLDPGAICQDGRECCSDYCRAITYHDLMQLQTCAATCRGRACSPQTGCCRGFACEEVISQFFSCGGCGDSGFPCANDADCCFSACAAAPGSTQKHCLSSAGGPCEKNYDCRSCTLNAECVVTTNGSRRDVCQDGVCGCPYECCADFQCQLNEFCQVDADGLRGECKPIVGP